MIRSPPLKDDDSFTVSEKRKNNKIIVINGELPLKLSSRIEKKINGTKQKSQSSSAGWSLSWSISSVSTLNLNLFFSLGVTDAQLWLLWMEIPFPSAGFLQFSHKHRLLLLFSDVLL